MRRRHARVAKADFSFPSGERHSRNPSREQVGSFSTERESAVCAEIDDFRFLRVCAETDLHLRLSGRISSAYPQTYPHKRVAVPGALRTMTDENSHPAWVFVCVLDCLGTPWKLVGGGRGIRTPVTR
jgi:hypothetical protein